jgi:hypothetical protein
MYITGTNARIIVAISQPTNRFSMDQAAWEKVQVKVPFLTRSIVKLPTFVQLARVHTVYQYRYPLCDFAMPQ